jgi:hypothetical protein
MTDQQNVTPGTTNDAASSDAVINEALSVIDGALAKMMQRDLVSTGEVADLLLDVRTLLTDVQPTPSVNIADIEPVTPELA